MKRRIITALFLAIIAAPMVSAKSGDPGELFNFGISARALGLADAYTATADGANALYYNPGGIGRMEQKQLSLMHATLFKGASYDYVGYGHPYRTGGFAVGIVNLGTSKITGKDDFNNPASDFSYTETALSLGWSHRGFLAIKNLSFGLGAKAMQRTLAGESDNLYGVDGGIKYGPVFDNRVNFGFALKNLLSFSNGDTDDKMPLENRIGVSWEIVRNLMLVFDAVDLKDVAVGMEYAWGPVNLRLGYAPSATGNTANLPMAGIGFKYKSFSVDYAMSNSVDMGEMSQRISMEFRFGKQRTTTNISLAEKQLANFRSYTLIGEYPTSRIYFEKAIELLYPYSPNEEDSIRYQNTRKIIKAFDLENNQFTQEFFRSNAPISVMLRQSLNYLLEGERDKALMYAQAALGTQPDNKILETLLKFVEEETSLKRSRDEIVPLPKLIQVKMRKSEISFLSRRFFECVKICKEIIFLDPKNVLAYTRMGSAYFMTGDKQRAAETYDKALELNPDDKGIRDFIKLHLKNPQKP